MCDAIWDRLHCTEIPPPSMARWLASEQGFRDRWNFPNCLGAIDGKHIHIQAPPNSGSMYFNYKGRFSVVLMAVADFNYKFSYVSVGAYGSNNDSSVFNESTFAERLEQDDLGIPPDCVLPNDEGGKRMPMVFVADEAFRATSRVLRPYPRGRAAVQLDNYQKIFNFRLSRARRVVENAFGILTARWRFLLRPVQMDPTKVDSLVKAAVVLHNLLTDEGDRCVRDVLADQRRNATGRGNLRATASRHAGEAAKQVREYFCQYFHDEGRIADQEARAHVNV